MKNKNFFNSVKCGVLGVLTAIQSEKNFKIYAWNVLVTFTLNVALRVSMVEFLIYLVCVVGVIATECANTAIEQLCDFIKQENDNRIKVIKDVSAGAVLCWGMAFYIVECVIIFTRILKM